MAERKVVHQIKLDRSVKALLWGFVAAIALNAVPDGYLIEDAEAQTLAITIERGIKDALTDCSFRTGTRWGSSEGLYIFRCSS